MIDTLAFFGDPELQRFTSSGVDLVLGDYAIPIVAWSVAKRSDLVEPDDQRAIGPCQIVGPEWFDPVATSEVKCGTLEYQLNAFLEDGIHPSTLAMGLMANEFIKAFDSTYGLKIKPLTTTEILHAAGIKETAKKDDCDD